MMRKKGTEVMDRVDPMTMMMTSTLGEKLEL
jgi:hypothetical protein